MLLHNWLFIFTFSRLADAFVQSDALMRCRPSQADQGKRDAALTLHDGAKDLWLK